MSAVVVARKRRITGAFNQQNGVEKSDIHWNQIPEKPFLAVAAATVIGWSEAVPVSKARMIIIPSPKSRGMKSPATD